MPGPILWDTGVSGLVGEIRMSQLDVEVPDVRGCRSPEITAAANQGMGGGGALNKELARARHRCSALPLHHLKFLVCKMGVIIIVPASECVCKNK